MSFFIEKIIFDNRAPFDHFELNCNENEVLILNAINGGGKTTILSHIVDAWHEMARPYFENEFENKKNKYYRIASGLYNKDLNKPSFVYIRFDMDGNKIDYIDIVGKPTQEQYDTAIKIENKLSYSEISRKMSNSNTIKYVSGNLTKSTAESLFGNNIITYFPSYRFEYPGYLNSPYADTIKFQVDSQFTGYLQNPLEVVTDLHNLTNWMMDVVLDWQINKELKKLILPDKRELMFDDSSEKIRIWDILNKIVDSTISKKDMAGTLRLGIGKRTNPSSRITIMLDKKGEPSATLYPTIYNISSGEAAVLTIFGEILRQSDNINKLNQATGIVLIDEIDKHLHIKIQKEVLPQLINLFPNIQFIVSTHSPFVSMGFMQTLKDRCSLIDVKNGNRTELFNESLYEEVYEMMIAENDNYKKLWEKLNQGHKGKQLLVEDAYDQIYKIAWLKLRNIDFNKDNLCEAFEKNADFEILSGFACGGIAGAVNTNNVKIFGADKIVGLFDYDQEGSEKFYNLKEGFTKNDIQGNLEKGFYRKKIIKNCNKEVYAAILPIPKRLNPLIHRSSSDELWRGDGKTSNFVEIETLLDKNFLSQNKNCRKETFHEYEYYLVKDEKKEEFWHDLVDQPSEIFADFIPLFNLIHELLCIDKFM